MIKPNENNPDKTLQRKILITGSSKGIGETTARILSSKGHEIFLTGRNKDRLKKISEEINAAGFLAGDLSVKCFAQELVNSAAEAMGGIDILINNAGSYIWSPIEKHTEITIDNYMNLNLRAPFELCEAVVPIMKKNNWGRIINIGSISGAVGEANASLYSACKAGLIGLTKSLALELAECGITVNIINPGWVKTDILDECINSKSHSEAEELQMIPQKRWIEPEEIAYLVEFIVSDSSQSITGQSLNICAGLSLG